MTEQNEQSTPPSSHRAPEALSTQAENELICEKLLGWRRLCHNGVTWWELPSTGKFQPTMLVALSFETWAEASLILDAIQKCPGWQAANACSKFGWLLKTRELTPLAIRAAALEYIRSLP